MAHDYCQNAIKIYKDTIFRTYSCFLIKKDTILYEWNKKIAYFQWYYEFMKKLFIFNN